MSPTQLYEQGQVAEQGTQDIRANSLVPVRSETPLVKNLLSRLKDGEALGLRSSLLRERASPRASQGPSLRPSPCVRDRESLCVSCSLVTP